MKSSAKMFGAGCVTFRAALLVATSSIALAGTWHAVEAAEKYCKGIHCKTQTRGQKLDNASTVLEEVGANTEAQSPDDPNDGGYSISVDGEVVAGSRKIADRQRLVDKRLDAVDIQVKFDGLDAKPILNISTVPIQQSYHAGEVVKFLAFLNYPDWIERSEVRVFELGTLQKGQPLATLSLAQNGTAIWNMPNDGPDEMVYVLRVYDDRGRFDETRPLALTRTTKEFEQHEPKDAAVAPGYAEDATAFRNIPVYGGSVTVFGTAVPDQNSVLVMGRAVPVDREGKFVTQRILPPGQHSVAVRVLNAKKKGLEFSRDINIPSSEWFYVALADLTVGHRFGSSAVQATRPGEFDNIYTKGRLAFYLRGKIKGQTLLTAAADTGENDLKSMLKGLDGKDPRQFLKRIDPDKYYPVYGDDSTSVEDAPTRGKFYVRLERGDSHVMWGNFKTQITGTHFLRNERALYGASAVYKSPEQAPNNEHRTQASAYASLPGTLPQRDVLRGTGGSAYFLKQQDISIGSETVHAEIRDATTNEVISRRQLKYGVDYDFDYTQGLIILKQPLPSTSSDGAVVANGTSGGNPVFLAVAYEFTPAASNVKGYATGGRGQQWIGDHVRVGATAAREKTGDANQTAMGADVRVQHSDNTYFEAEVAHSKGPGFGTTHSADGGLTLSDQATSGVVGKAANAYRIAGHADVSELTSGAAKGDVEAHYSHQDDGFSSLDEQIAKSRNAWGGSAVIKISPKSDISASYAESHISDGHLDRDTEGHADIAMGDHITLSPGARHTDHRDPTAGAKDVGKRTDLGLRLTYDINDDRNVYVFGQVTAHKDNGRRNNDRIGLGGETKLTEKTSLSAEASYGTGGIAGRAQLGYNPSADDSYYIGYKLDPDRRFGVSSYLDGNDLGSVVAGVKHRYSERLSIFAEDSYDLFGLKRSLAQTYGVTYAPDARWSVGSNIELGHIVDGTINTGTGLKNGDFDRKALSGTVAYKDNDGNIARIKSEARFDRSEDHSRDLDSYLLSETFELRANPNWRFLGNLDAVISNSTDSTRDGTYVEASLGYAYRPIDNDRLNALFKYIYLYDLPGKDQVAVGGTTAGPQQQSHIFSIDANYDLTKFITVGAKYGFRIGETRPRDSSSGWTKGSAHLGVIRADLNIVHNWDALAEARLLWTPGSKSKDLGLLIAGYRHIGDNFKIGVGYNFGRFSDDLRDQSYSSHGIFLNAVGQF
jgi:hypothetical protein